MRKAIAAIATATAVCMTPAHADDMGTNIATQLWPGLSCHGAAMLGFAVAGINVDSTGNDLPIQSEGAVGEVSAGCDVRLGYDVIVGTFGSFQLSDSDVTFDRDGETLKVAIDERYTIGIRMGASLRPDVMIYGKGGYVTASTSGPWGNLDGWLMGAGIETMLTKHIGLRVEADHTRYSNETLAGANAKPSETQIKAGAVVRF